MHARMHARTHARTHTHTHTHTYTHTQSLLCRPLKPARFYKTLENWPFAQSPSLISLMVSVDVKHHVYLLTYLPFAATACSFCSNIRQTHTVINPSRSGLLTHFAVLGFLVKKKSNTISWKYQYKIQDKTPKQIKPRKQRLLIALYKCQRTTVRLFFLIIEAPIATEIATGLCSFLDRETPVFYQQCQCAWRHKIPTDWHHVTTVHAHSNVPGKRRRRRRRKWVQTSR